MAHKVEWLNFYIVLTDPKQVKTLKDAHPYGVLMAPNDAATQYSAPWKGYDDPKTGAPYSWTPFSGANSKGGVYPLNVATFSRKSGGFWIFGGTTTTFNWLGQFQLAGQANDPTSTGPISLRRWIEGFEHPGLSPWTIPAGMMVMRDAARHVGGLGLGFRGATSGVLGPITLAQYGYNDTAVVGGLVNGAHSWERFYIRLRRKPTTGAVPFWKCGGAPTAACGIILLVTPSGQLAVYSNDAANAQTNLGTVVTLTEWDPVTNPNAWRRIDLQIKYATPAAADASFTVYVDGVVLFQSGANCLGLNGTARHAQSQFGLSSGVANDLELDIDDWMCADIPYTIVAGARQETFVTKDFKAGSKIVALRPKAFSTNHNAAGWPGDFRLLLQLPINAIALSSTTANALAAVDADSADVIDADTGQIGTAAVLVEMGSTRGTTSGQLGLTANGVTTMVNVTQSAVAASNQMMISQPGTSPSFTDLTPIELRHAKGNDGNAATLYSLMAQAELIGTWGKEDLPFPNTAEDQAAQAAITFPTPTGQHNAQYPHSPWALGGNAPPISPFIVKTGTYVGNNTGQDLAFRAPVNWLFMRPTTGGAGGYQWFSSMISAHKGMAETMRPQMPIGLEDLSFAGSVNEQQQQSYILRIGGNDNQINAVGVTYQYIAVSDPGMRFMLNTSFFHRTADGAVINKLVNATFTPIWAFLMLENYSAGATIRLYGKGPGNAADNITVFAGAAVVTNCLTFGTGQVTSRATVHGVGEVGALSLWRQADGNADPGQSGTWQVVTWTGDGNATRSIGLVVSGLRPLFALAFTEANASGYWRDASHTGSNSTNSGGADVTTGITGGAIDGFTIGSSLNTNGVIYNAFLLMGSATAGNNGWSINGEFENGEFYSPTDGPWGVPPAVDNPTLDPDTTAVTDPGADANPDVSDEPDLDNVIDLPGTTHVCVYFTQRIVNEALARIGVSKQVADLRTDLTIEAVVARLNMRYDVESTLRDYPWPFATTYKRLALVAGSAASPVNADWTYAYRRPWDCMFERRLVVARGYAADPTPPPFALGSDAGGGLIYCNVANVTLEYTGRKICPTYEGDVLFRDALAWRVAERLAPALTRIEAKAQACRQAYELALQKARLILTPGKPGSVLPTVPLDTSVDHIAANVAVVNRALVRVGARTISSFAEQSREAVAALAIFEDELRSTLRDFPWPFATAYASPLTLVTGSAATPANDDWTYSYRLPTDFVYARRLVTESKRAFEAEPPTFKIATDGTGSLLYTDRADAILEYTARPVGVVALADPLFRDAFAWRLAASLAASLTDADPDVAEQLGRGPDDPAKPPERRATRTQLRRQIADRAWSMYVLTLSKARVAAANEQQQDPPPDAPWITGR